MLAIFLAALAASSAANAEDAYEVVGDMEAEFLERAKHAEEEPGPETRRELSPEERAEKIMRSLAEAYPGKIARAEYRNGDWAVLMEGKWYYCAGGRLRPEELLPRKESYSPHPFYDYFPQLPEWKVYEGEAAPRMKNFLKDHRANPPNRAPAFFDTLWDAQSRGEARGNLVRISFLGKSVPVHKTLAGRLAKVEARIREAAKTDPAVRDWINGIGTVSAWNWRNIAATGSRSFHSYAAALDILPKNLGKLDLHVYWQWSAASVSEWYNIPYSRRWHPPDGAVKAFEAYGFCCGGKWPLFDTMHFEYRPVILLMSGMPVEN